MKVLVADLTNIQRQFHRDNHTHMWDFIKNLELTGHSVRWLTDSDNRICSVFFIDQHGIYEAKKQSECIIIDATYKTDSHNMVLLNLVLSGTLRSKERPKQLTTVPFAGCWMDHETGKRYNRALRCFRKTMWGEESDCFIRCITLLLFNKLICACCFPIQSKKFITYIATND